MNQISIILIAFFLVGIYDCSQCQVTAIKSFWSCVNYCANKYQGKKMYYNRWNGFCEIQKKCSDGKLLRYYENTCVDGSSLKVINNTIQVLNHQLFEVVYKISQHGKVINGSYVCYPGWKSSYHKQQIAWKTFKQYYCDIKMKDGQIYPMSHGQYFFNLLDHSLKIQAINYVYQYQTIFDYQFIIFCILTITFINIHIFQCLYVIRKKYRRNKKKQQKLELNYSNPQEENGNNKIKQTINQNLQIQYLKQSQNQFKDDHKIQIHEEKNVQIQKKSTIDNKSKIYDFFNTVKKWKNHSEKYIPKQPKIQSNINNLKKNIDTYKSSNHINHMMHSINRKNVNKSTEMQDQLQQKQKDRSKSTINPMNNNQRIKMNSHNNKKAQKSKSHQKKQLRIKQNHIHKENKKQMKQKS